MKKTLIHSLIDHIPHAIFWKDTNLIFRGCNLPFAQQFGYSDPQELIGKSDYDFPFTPELVDQYHQDDLNILHTGVSKLNYEEIQTQSDGSKKIVLVSKVPFYDEKQNVIGILGIYMDITERKLLEEALFAAKNKAETASLAKTEFIANMSHDIRTPLTGIVGLSKILEEQVGKPEEKLHARWINESGEQLLALLNSVLETIKADSLKENDVELEWFDLRDCIKGLIQLEQPAIHLKQLKMELVIDETIPAYIFTDSTKIHRILLNLLSNAVKFTTVGGIQLKVSMIKQEDISILQFCVNDTGSGIEQDSLDKIFERFYRITPSYKGTHSGHGVGLHIAKQYTDLLKGTLICKSKPGEGSSFILELPVKVSQSPSDVLPEPFKPKVDRNLAKPVTILLVEDNPIALRVLEKVVNELGASFVTTTTGQEALNLATQQPFDLIITDIGLPDISGIELTKAIRTFETVKGRMPTPIVGLTAHASEEMHLECSSAGMQEALAKPITAEKLLDALSFTRSLTVTSDSTKNEANLGTDLPDTIEELFQLESYHLLDNAMGLENCGSIQLLDELITTLTKTELPSVTQKLKDAHKHNDWKAIENGAHHLKSSALYCGAHRLKMACQYLERSQKVKLIAQQEKLYQQLMNVISETNDFLEQYVRLMHI